MNLLVTRHTLLQSIFSLENSGSSTFRSKPPHMGGAYAPGRLFGGQAVAQAYRAIQETRKQHTEAYGAICTLHHKFTAPGKTTDHITYKVKNIEDVSRVVVSSGERIIGSVHARFSECLFSPPVMELDYVISPEHLTSLEDMGQNDTNLDSCIPPELKIMSEAIFDIRCVEWARKPQTNIPRTLFWARIPLNSRYCVPRTSGIEVALLISDFFIIQVTEEIGRMYGYATITAASLHHSVRFHQINADAYQWFLYRTEMEVMTHGRAKIIAYVYDKDMNCVLSIIQEAYSPMKEKHLIAKI